MRIHPFLIFSPVSNVINQNPNPNAVYLFDPGICILQLLDLLAKLITKDCMSMLMEKRTSNFRYQIINLPKKSLGHAGIGVKHPTLEVRLAVTRGKYVVITVAARRKTF